MQKRIFSLVLAGILAFSGTALVSADEEDDIKNAKAQAEDQLNETNSTLNSLAEKQAEVQSQISSVNADLVDTMIRISEAEEDVETAKQNVASTQSQIDEIQAQLETENANKDQQYADMVKRIQYIYENGGQGGWTTILLKAGSLSNFLNRIEYTQALEKADREALTSYEETISQISASEQALVEQKNELETQQASLEAQEAALEDEKADLENQLDEAEAANSDYESQISEARQQASEIESLIEQQQSELNRIEEEKAEAAKKAAEEEAARKAAEESAAAQSAAAAAAASSSAAASSGSSSSSSSSSSGSSSSSSAGQQIVDYAMQFVGKIPYVWGGGSLETGVDCSHFVYLVLKNCGYYSGGYMTSGYWATAGTPVSSLAEAQAGDIIVYSGHVAIYDGNGMIVEAKGRAYGLTHDRRADSKPIVAIRRFV